MGNCAAADVGQDVQWLLISVRRASTVCPVVDSTRRFYTYLRKLDVESTVKDMSWVLGYSPRLHPTVRGMYGVLQRDKLLLHA